MHKFAETIAKKTSRGFLQVVQGTLTVYESGTGNLASLYADDGTTPLLNPLNADTEGLVECKMHDGIYDLVFNDGVSEKRIDGYVAIGGVMV